MSNILKQVTFDRANRKKDRSISLTFITTLEQTPKEFMDIDTLLSDFGTLYFKSGGSLSKKELNALDDIKIETEGKSKSQRLRAVLFVEHKQKAAKGLTNLDTNQYYAVEMEKEIEKRKQNLDND